jgi:hypothetical protein
VTVGGTAGFLEPATSSYATLECNPAADLGFYVYLVDQKAVKQNLRHFGTTIPNGKSYRL